MEKIDDFLLGILREYFYPIEAEAAGEGTGPSISVTAAGKFLMKSEETIITFLNTADRVELDFPPLNSYYRRILHRLSRRYNLSHRVEATNIFNSASTLRKFYLTKPVGEDLVGAAPVLKCCEWIEGGVEYNGEIRISGGQKGDTVKDISSSSSSSRANDVIKPVDPADAPKAKFKILKRQSATDENPIVSGTTEAQGCVSPLNSNGLSLEEREAKYQAARERIFEGFTSQSIAQSCAQSGDSQTAVPETRPLDTLPLDSQSAVSGILPLDSLPPQSALSPLNPDAIPFNFIPLTSPTSIDHIYLITSTSSPLSLKALNQILAQFPPTNAVIKCRSVPTDSCFLLLKASGVTTPTDDANWLVRKWEPEFYLD